MRRGAYGGDGTDMVHAEAEGGSLAALEERSVCSRYCPGARAEEQERRLSGLGSQRRDCPNSTPASWGNPSVESQDPIDAALVPPLERPGNIGYTLTAPPALPQFSLLLGVNHVRAV